MGYRRIGEPLVQSKWHWAHQDLNLGPIDYDDLGGLALITLQQTHEAFFWALIFNLKQAEPVPT